MQRKARRTTHNAIRTTPIAECIMQDAERRAKNHETQKTKNTCFSAPQGSIGDAGILLHNLHLLLWLEGGVGFVGEEILVCLCHRGGHILALLGGADGGEEAVFGQHLVGDLAEGREEHGLGRLAVVQLVGREVVVLATGLHVQLRVDGEASSVPVLATLAAHPLVERLPEGDDEGHARDAIALRLRPAEDHVRSREHVLDGVDRHAEEVGAVLRVQHRRHHGDAHDGLEALGDVLLAPLPDGHGVAEAGEEVGVQEDVLEAVAFHVRHLDEVQLSARADRAQEDVLDVQRQLLRRGALVLRLGLRADGAAVQEDLHRALGHAVVVVVHGLLVLPQRARVAKRLVLLLDDVVHLLEGGHPLALSPQVVALHRVQHDGVLLVHAGLLRSVRHARLPRAQDLHEARVLLVGDEAGPPFLRLVKHRRVALVEQVAHGVVAIRTGRQCRRARHAQRVAHFTLRDCRRGGRPFGGLRLHDGLRQGHGDAGLFHGG
mmetsp:Transcript_14740/g.55789  ORF Transcript_14740/g.55789 Transcript_14740/m.55789 type:complete len:490 (+) Transcript_14740:2423-3892(+)